MLWETDRVETKLLGAGEMLGTTDPTLGTGEEISGDIDGIAESCESNVTSVPPPSLITSLSPPVEKNKKFSKIIRCEFRLTFCGAGGTDGLVYDEGAILVSNEY